MTVVDYEDLDDDLWGALAITIVPNTGKYGLFYIQN